MGTLSYLKVLGLSRVLARLWASRILANLDVDVINIERQLAYFVGANRNRRSVAIDLASLADQKLASQCGVLLENFKVGSLKA